MVRIIFTYFRLHPILGVESLRHSLFICSYFGYTKVQNMIIQFRVLLFQLHYVWNYLCHI